MARIFRKEWRSKNSRKETMGWKEESNLSLFGVKLLSLMKKHRKLSIKIIGLLIMKLMIIRWPKLSKLDAVDGKLRMKAITFSKITVII
jgi:hypothetical protein